MKKTKRIVIAVSGILLLLAFLLVGGIIYRTQYAKTEISTSYSQDSTHELVIYQIGEPEFPFGPGNIRLILYGNGRRINRQDMVIYNDGKTPQSEDFSVLWSDDRVSVTVSAEEMDDITYTLYFDGRKEPEQ